MNVVGIYSVHKVSLGSINWSLGLVEAAACKLTYSRHASATACSATFESEASRA